MAAAAALELRPGKAGAVAAADAWWNYAETKKGTVKDAALRHATDLYQKMLPDLSGLDKVRVEKRVQESANNPSTDSDWLITQYIRDDFGSLRLVIQPEDAQLDAIVGLARRA